SVAAERSTASSGPPQRAARRHAESRPQRLRLAQRIVEHQIVQHRAVAPVAGYDGADLLEREVPAIGEVDVHLCRLHKAPLPVDSLVIGPRHISSAGFAAPKSFPTAVLT